MTSNGLPQFLTPLVAQLRRRALHIGVGDLCALRESLHSGFGLSSREDLRELCVHLWATSPDEADIIRAAFTRLGSLEDWAAAGPAHDSMPPEDSGEVTDQAPQTEIVQNAGIGSKRGTPGTRAEASSRGLVLAPQYPLTGREIAQIWRRLRSPVRSGPKSELDITATIRERTRRGVATPPVLVPRRRNAVRLLLLIDRHGSMTPFHGYVDHVTNAIRDAGRIDEVCMAYFHDLPGSAGDKSPLTALDDPFRQELDGIVHLISPMREGRVYEDPGLTKPNMLDAILVKEMPAPAIAVISDAGAARRQFDTVRLLGSLALVKALRQSGGGGLAWLNPAPRTWWAGTTAGQLARYVPMTDFSRQGLSHAVDALRGRPVPVEHPA